jgi:hypothetical protein
MVSMEIPVKAWIGNDNPCDKANMDYFLVSSNSWTFFYGSE